MKKTRFILSSFFVLTILGIILKSHYDNVEYTLTKSENERLEQIMENNPEVEFSEIIGRTYRVYYSDDLIITIGDENDASKAIERLNLSNKS